MRKQKLTHDETTTILIACLFNLANAMSAVFMNVYLYVYTGSLVVMSIYTIVRIGLFPFFFTLGGKWRRNIALPDRWQRGWSSSCSAWCSCWRRRISLPCIRS